VAQPSPLVYVPLLLRLENDPNMPLGDIRVRISKNGDMSQGEDVLFDSIADKVTQFTAELAGEGGDEKPMILIADTGIRSQAMLPVTPRKIAHAQSCLPPGGVADHPIHLKVLRKGSPNLTLIDLPGIAYNTADQGLAGDIAEMTKSLIVKYITPPDMIIVVVLPAADDFGAHEAIKLANIHDPTGTRTLGVVTKVSRYTSHTGIYIYSYIYIYVRINLIHY